MRRAKRLPLAIAGSAIAALVVASAITGQAAVGLQGGTVAYGAQKPPAKKPVGAKRALAAMPLAFVRNEGQTNPRVRYYAVGNHYAFFATPRRADALADAGQAGDDSWRSPSASSAAARQVTTTGARTIPGTVNYLHGSDPSKWQTQAVALPRASSTPSSGRASTCTLHQQAGALKYEFHVRPGRPAVGHPARVRRRHAAWRSTRRARCASRPASAPCGTRAPVSYQEHRRHARAGASRYVLRGRQGRRALRVRSRRLPARPRPGHRPGHPVHDLPRRRRATRSATASPSTRAGNSYIAARRSRPTSRPRAGAFRRTGAASNFSDVFVTQAEPGRHGARLLDVRRRQRPRLRAPASRSTRPATPTSPGQTKSSNFPTTGGAFDRSLQHPAELPALRHRQHRRVRRSSSTPPARHSRTRPTSAAPTSTRRAASPSTAPGNAYVTGETLSTDFPTTAGAFSRTLPGAYDMFVTKLNTDRLGARRTRPSSAARRSTTAERIAVDAGGQRLRARLHELDRLPDDAGRVRHDARTAASTCRSRS